MSIYHYKKGNEYRRIMKKKFLWIVLPLLLTSCDPTISNSISTPPTSTNGSSSLKPSEDGVITDEDYLKVDGELVKNQSGTGETVYLRGINAGDYLLIEQWMAPFTNQVGPYLDHKRISDIFTDRFGYQTMQELWALYRSYFWKEVDFQNIVDMGMNVIRLPFTYMNVDIDGEYDFTQLDDFVDLAREHNLYVILDLHGAYGSQNGKDHSGQIIDNIEDIDFYTNEEKIGKTIDLWEALTEHYLGDPTIAAFDILNEPGELAGSTSERHWKVFDRIYDKIREVDQDRIVIFESCWDAVNLPDPSTYGWENCMYSYHNYAGTSSGTAITQQAQSYNSKFSGAKKADYKVPNYMGEFNCYEDEETWNYVMRRYNEEGWHYTSWTYKIDGSSAWGIYNLSPKKIEPTLDDIDTIREKMSGVDTSKATLHKFNSGKTLFDVMKDSVTQEKLSAPVDYLENMNCRITTDDGYLFFNDGKLTVNPDAEVFSLIYNDDGTYSIRTSEGKYWRCNTGDNSNPIDNSSTSASTWEKFYIYKRGDAYVLSSYNAGRYLSYSDQVNADDITGENALLINFEEID